ncbi:hypothetical protein IPN41_04390 [Candidatus Falkowbacteria bacterium]|nr:MAG: hypothetical protein IPN41_04390 [Candidatus Falkowbacteria bacterium]
MKIIRYYFALLLFIVLFFVFLWYQNLNTMTMPMMIISCFLLVFYVITLSLVGEGKQTDERESHHRYIANRGALLAGTIVISLGILYQLFNHQLDYWLLASLVVINLVKISSFLYLEYKK